MFKIGIPGGLFYYTYRPFITTFFDSLSVSVTYSTKSGKKILEEGCRSCVDEACLPVKMFAGHAKILAPKCEYIALPRIMSTEFGESICPKFCGLPELVNDIDEEQVIFNEPIYLHNEELLYKSLWSGVKKTGIGKKIFDEAFDMGVHWQRYTLRGFDEKEYKYKVLLAGHSYNIYDEYANLSLIKKLHALDIGVITEERVNREDKEKASKELIKRPYWTNLMNLYGAAVALDENKAIDGIIYLSSFCCGTDSIILELIESRLPHIPILVQKIDEQTGEAGFDTRLEAFQYVLSVGGEIKIG